MKFIEFNKQLKISVEPLYNIKGDDFFLIKQTLSNIKNHLIKDLEEFNFSTFEAEKMKKDEIYEQLSILPIGNEYRLIVLNNPSQEVIKYLNVDNSFLTNLTKLAMENKLDPFIGRTYFIN